MTSFYDSICVCPNDPWNFELPQKSSPKEDLAEDVIFQIFSFLPPEALARAASVSKIWRSASSTRGLWENSLKNISPKIERIGPQEWAKHVNLAEHGLNIGDIPPLDKIECFRFASVVRRMIASVEDDAGVTVLTIPKGLSMRVLEQIAQKNDGIFFKGWRKREILEPFEGVSVERSYHSVISNNVLSASKGKSLVAQEQLVTDLGCEVPRLLPTATLVILQNMISKRYLFSSGSFTFTRCAERRSDRSVTLGNSNAQGVALTTDVHGDTQLIGMAAQYNTPST